VGERAREQRTAFEPVAQAVLQGFEARGHHGYFERPSYFSSTYTGPQMGTSLLYA